MLGIELITVTCNERRTGETSGYWYCGELVEPCINEAIGNETTDDNLIPLNVITHVYLTMLTGDCGWVVLLVLFPEWNIPGTDARQLCTRISCSQFEDWSQ